MYQCHCHDEAWEDGYDEGYAAAQNELSTKDSEVRNFVKQVQIVGTLPYHAELKNLPDDVEVYLQQLTRVITKLCRNINV